MLAALGIARLLTAPMLEWLTFPTWRTRYRNAREQQAGGESVTYQVTRNVHVRLAGLVDLGLIARITRTAEHGALVYQRLPDAYTLTEAGAETLCERRGADLDMLWYMDHRTRAIQNLEHSLTIGQCYAALTAETDYRTIAFADWRGDHMLARRDTRFGINYDRITVAGQREPIAVLPDATFTLQQQRHFIEIDRGTRPLTTWTAKIRAYEAYQGSAPLRDRYGTDTFQVLIVAPTETRLERIANEIARVTRQAPSHYRFLLIDHLHPTTIRRGWRTIADLQLTPRKVVNKVVDVAQATLHYTPLWEQA